MNLSGIWNNLPDLPRSQQTGNSAPAASNVPPSGASGASSLPAAPNGGKTDQADLSNSGMAAAQSVQSGASDVRMEKVDSVRAAINAGTYQISAQDVAGKIIQNLLG